MKSLTLFLLAGISFISCTTKAQSGEIHKFEINKTDAQWKKELTPEQFSIARKKGTERPFTGATHDNHEHGIYSCVCCKLELFSSETKFESGTGWPSFWNPLTSKSLYIASDDSHGMQRDEVMCARCGGHLGHVFDDGPKPTGKRYCMNSASMIFTKTEKKK